MTDVSEVRFWRPSNWRWHVSYGVWEDVCRLETLVGWGHSTHP